MGDTWRARVDAAYGDAVERSYEDGLLAVLDEPGPVRGPDLMLDLLDRVGPGPGDVLLDVGSRDGRHLVELHGRYGCRVVGVEPAPGNLERMRRVHGGPPHPVARAVAEALPVATGSVDVAWIRDVLVHVDPLAPALAEVARVLRPGGAAVVFRVVATPLLEPVEAEELWRLCAVAPASAEGATFDAAVAAAGLVVEHREDVGSEWREHREVTGTLRASEQLLRIARLRRDPERYRAALGREVADGELGNALYGVYQLLGKLTAVLDVLRSPGREM